ncbi:MAG: EscU/YscU/HrcU family type III secretion system export apparatus switch protein, partial [Pyrinomonadaceae bacterium]|nr:EscU/YscU/HrcU family type III secretion system export apparatus switch protein [Pyrinomonadaceae bacterium]
QGGLTFSPKALAPNAQKFSPAANFKQAFSGNSVVELGKGILKLSAISIICGGTLMSAVSEAPTLIGAPATHTFVAVGHLAYSLGLQAGGALICMLVLDYGYGWYKHEKSLRMTKQEVKDEYKQQEGDPYMKGKRRNAARALTQQRISVEVPRADVVVTNPTHFAVALRYNHERDAVPVVVAKGADHLALRIREIARAHDVMVIENPPLARTLYLTIEPGRAIPAELFRAVAELLAYVYQKRTRAAGA